MNDVEKQLIELVAGRRERLVNWARDLVAIPTVNPYSGDDSAGSEAPGQNWIEDVFLSLGATTQRVAVPADVYERGRMIGPAGRRWIGRDNVVARWTLGDGQGPTLLINDHMDTVGTAGMSIAPFDPVVKDGRLFGRGASDTKGNMAMGLTAVQAVLEHSQGLHGRIIFESVVDEECNGGGAGTLACCLEGIGSDFALVLDGMAGQVINGCNGIATAKLVVRGLAGHSSVGRGVNAIDKAILVKQLIDRFGAEHVRQFPRCLYNIGIFRSGTLPAIVPNEAEIQVNLNYALEDALAAQEQTGWWGGALFRRRFEQAIAASVAEDDWFKQQPVEVSWIKDMYPYLSDADHPLVELAARTMTEVFAKDIHAAPMTAWFDGAHLARQLNIPVVSLGQGTPGYAHSADEQVIIDDLVRGAQAVALVAHRFLRRA